VRIFVFTATHAVLCAVCCVQAYSSTHSLCCTYLLSTLLSLPDVVGMPLESQGDFEVKVTSDQYDVNPIDHSDVPVFVAFAKIGDALVCDPTLEEEACMNSVLSVAIDQDGRVCGAKQDGMGGIAPSTLCEMISHAKEVGSGAMQGILEASKQ
jgi:exosome complex RNA-binding protein Rrp42 (RNase PH superfamily)